MLSYILSLTIVITGNVILNCVACTADCTFNLRDLIFTIFKGITVLIVMVGLYFVGHLNPTIIRISMENMSVNFSEAVVLIFVGAIAKYGYDIVIKLLKILDLNHVSTEFPESMADMFNTENEKGTESRNDHDNNPS